MITSTSPARLRRLQRKPTLWTATGVHGPGRPARWWLTSSRPPASTRALLICQGTAGRGCGRRQVDRRARAREQPSDLADRVLAGIVQRHEMSFLLGRQLRLLAVAVHAEIGRSQNRRPMRRGKWTQSLQGLVCPKTVSEINVSVSPLSTSFETSRVVMIGLNPDAAPRGSEFRSC